MTEELELLEFEDLTMAGGFTSIPNWILTAPNLSDSACRLYSIILMHGFKQVGGGRRPIFPKRERLAEKLNKKIRTVDLLLRELKDIGLLDWKRRGKKSNRYIIKAITPEVLRKLGYDPAALFSQDEEEEERPDTNENKAQKIAPYEIKAQNFAPYEIKAQNIATYKSKVEATKPEESSDPAAGSGAEERKDNILIKKEKEKENNAHSAPSLSSQSEKEKIDEVWKHWLKSFEGYYQRATLTEKRKKAIRARLQNFTVEELKTVIDEVRRSPWHMGQNEDKKLWINVETIFRNDEKVEDWVNKAALRGKKNKPSKRPENGDQNRNKYTHQQDTIDREKLKAERLAKKRAQQAEQAKEENKPDPEFEAALKEIEKRMAGKIDALKEMEKRMNGLTA